MLLLPTSRQETPEMGPISRHMSGGNISDTPEIHTFTELYIRNKKKFITL